MRKICEEKSLNFFLGQLWFVTLSHQNYPIKYARPLFTGSQRSAIFFVLNKFSIKFLASLYSLCIGQGWTAEHLLNPNPHSLNTCLPSIASTILMIGCFLCSLEI